VTDVAILKKLGVLEIDVMRLIHLMDADFQSNKKLVGKKALANAEMCDQKARHRIKTGFGIFEPVYGDEEPPIQGSGQGYGIAPTTGAH